MAAKQAKAKLIEGDVGRTLVSLTIPMLLAILTMVAFNLADTYFVGRLGELELAAMGFTISVVMLVGSLSQGLGVGASAVVARAIGEGDFKQVQRLATDSLVLAVVIVAIISFIGLLTIDPLFALLGAGPDVMPFVREYMNIWYFSTIVVIFPMTGNAIIRATGDMKTPATIMFIAVGVNIILDPMMIFGWGPIPAMGIAGAAWATVLSRMVTMTAALYVLIRRERLLTFEIPTFAEMVTSWKKILYIALPSAGTSMLVPISTGIITGLISRYGSAAVAAYGVGSRIEMLALAVVMALSSTLTPFVAQNWGAGRMERVSLAIRYGTLFAVAWGIVFYALAVTLAGDIARVFNDTEAVQSVIVLFLVIVPISYAGQGVLLVSTSSLNALNKPLNATVLMALRLFVLYIPLAFIGMRIADINGIFIAAAVANFGAGVAGFFWLRRVLIGEHAAVTDHKVATPSGDVVGVSVGD